MLEKTNNLDEILSSLDGINRAGAPPFLYTRILARLNSHQKNSFENFTALISKPILAVSSLLLILLLDGLVLQSTLNMQGKSRDTAGNNFDERSGITNEEFLGVADFGEILIDEVPYPGYVAGY